MKAEVANFGNVHAMVKFCQLQHDKSSWKALPFNPVHVKKNLMKMVREPGLDALISVDDDGQIKGVLLASIDQFFMNKMYYATDVHFMCEAGGIQLFAEFKRWAVRNGAKKIIMGIGNDDPDGKVHRFYEMVGMWPVGDAWVYDLDDIQEKAA